MVCVRSLVTPLMTENKNQLYIGNQFIHRNSGQQFLIYKLTVHGVYVSRKWKLGSEYVLIIYFICRVDEIFNIIGEEMGLIIS